MMSIPTRSARAIVEFKDKKIEPSYYDFLEKRIKEYMDEIKEQINKEK
jgi:hypothetical protein